MIYEDRAGTLRGFWAILLALVLSVAATAQTESPAGAGEPKEEKAAAAETVAPAPFVTTLAEVSLGMSAAEVRQKLGKPDTSDKTGMLFTPSGTHSAQVGLDEKATVRTIALIYTDGDKKAPAFEDIFGADAEKPADTGTVYKMVRYPEAGFWLSYSVTSPGDKPMTVITMRRIE